MSTLCRDCGTATPTVKAPAGRCKHCGSPRTIIHPELDSLAIAHIDCDAFYANVEKRDDPALRDRPVIVGWGRRGVVLTACYMARLYGVRSAMPMFKALKACPDAVVLRPNMEKYRTVGHQIRACMREVTPLVEPLSIDEAFLDLTDTERRHHSSPAQTLARLALHIERAFGVTVSVGLSYNKFLAKIASDLDKPRGFAVIGRGEALAFLRPRPVGLIWGVGPALQQRLAGDGIRTVGDLQDRKERDLVARYGSIGRRLARFAHGEDDRRVEPHAPTKSVSAETTFDEDTAAAEALTAALRPLCDRVAERLKRANLAGHIVSLKLKTARFQVIARSRRLGAPTQRAEILFQSACALLEREADGRRFRLIGVGASDLVDGSAADPPDLFDPPHALLGRAGSDETAECDPIRSDQPDR
ncbi:DNA polymerase IV [Rhodospirillaceae bacterium SYSU D60014]|uniref:DNA polymerase IV n=1 Tax=Virgifigura deserti TaxID=2268457 RepID=UPI000E673E27